MCGVRCPSSDRHLLLQGLLPDDEDVKAAAAAAAAVKEAKEVADSREAREAKEAEAETKEADAEKMEERSAANPTSAAEAKEEAKVSAALEEKAPPSASSDAHNREAAPASTATPISASPSPSSASATTVKASPVTSPSSNLSASLAGQPGASLADGFPFFPFVLSDSSCLAVVCALVQSLAWEDGAVSRALVDCIFDLLHDLLNGHSTRLMRGLHVHHQPLQVEPSLGSPASSSALCRVSDFLTPFGAFSTLLSLSDSLTAGRVDLGLTRLFVLIRRVLSRRHAATLAGGGVGAGAGGVSGVVNGVEERFMLVAVRCLLRLSVTSRAVAVWLKGHEKEWQSFEALYTSSRHVMSHTIR